MVHGQSQQFFYTPADDFLLYLLPELRALSFKIENIKRSCSRAKKRALKEHDGTSIYLRWYFWASESIHTLEDLFGRLDVGRGSESYSLRLLKKGKLFVN